ncbi:tetratricopeptide (TPR) repeat protein [Algoriphagus sp. 4150]|uniref:tetratricopeptide repeat protein n=1 Tax=Algoriphagus sp. 4150 TaxID=2817756 RepID=UPI00285E8509|nr:tetratricopeptide repeat protein [Algoriphagus sp. 4150]MDR7131903.1 tetratricopeptide (TPR) repeat protein [Algoriphagus sp. 4150]
MSDTCMSHIENHWKALTLTANDCFNKEDFEKALSGYKEALYRAEVLNDHQENCQQLDIPFMQVFIISCNNLSNTYQKLGQYDAAEIMLKRAVHYLLHLSTQAHINMNELHHELKRASITLFNFKGEKIGEKEQEKLLRNIKEQLAENQSININRALKSPK